MRKIVDSNYLQSPKLAKYLASSSQNYAVMTDYAAMEAYKGDTLNGIYKSMGILVKHPRQVIVLKNTSIVAWLNGRGSGLQSRFIDHKQTREFSIFCRNLAAAENGNHDLERKILEHGRLANEHMKNLLKTAESMSSAVRSLTKHYTKDELRILRADSPLTEEMANKLIQDVLRIAAAAFTDNSKIQKWPDDSTLPNTFVFRSALCYYLLALEWIKVGGASGANAATLRNDIVDSNFAAYSTYFDGLLSTDVKLVRIYKTASFLLSNIFFHIYK